jgi:hypothetical protein
LEPTDFGFLKPIGLVSQPPAGNWQLEVEIATGFQGSAFVVGATEAFAQLLTEGKTLFRDCNLRSREYVPVTNEAEQTCRLVHVEFSHAERSRCRQFLDWLQSSLGRRPELGRIAGPRPQVDRSVEMLSLQVPAEQIPIAIDTRPAREWL